MLINFVCTSSCIRERPALSLKRSSPRGGIGVFTDGHSRVWVELDRAGPIPGRLHDRGTGGGPITWPVHRHIDGFARQVVPGRTIRFNHVVVVVSLDPDCTSRGVIDGVR